MTNLVEIKNDYVSGYYEEGYDDDPYSSGTIAGYGDIVNRVEGNLRARVLARVGKADGVVTITEHHFDIGYCVTCSYEEVSFQVAVDDQIVWNTGDYGSYGLDTTEQLTGFAAFNDWLNEKEDEVD